MALKPNAAEQFMLELVNAARANPLWQATQLGIDLNQGLMPGEISASEKQPLAFNPFLIQAARDYSAAMLDGNFFSHTGLDGSIPRDRIEDAGYELALPWGVGENISWRGTTEAVNVEAFITSSHNGLFESPGHRLNLMNDNFTEIGIGAVIGEYKHSNNIEYNSLMTTQKFAFSGNKTFLTGVVYDDRNNNNFYTIGEGLGGALITASGSAGIFETKTWDSGGYSLALPQGSYTVTVSYDGRTIQANVDIGTKNKKFDAVWDDMNPDSGTSVPPPGQPDDALTELINDYYRGILRDDAYPEEIEWAVEEIETGRMTLEELRDYLINAPWTQAYVKPVLLAYEAVYGRAPESGGLDFWVHQYRDFYELNDPSNPNVKEGLVQLLKPFVNPAQTAEFVDRYGANPSAGEFVGAAYANVLNRVPDQGGLDYWTQVYEINHAQIAAANPWMSWANVAVEARALILEQFVSSPEYAAATADAVNAFLHGAALGDTSVYSGSLWDLASHVAMMDAGEMVPAIEGSADIFWLDSMSWDISDTDRKEPAAALENPWPHPTLLGLPTDQNDGSMAV